MPIDLLTVLGRICLYLQVGGRNTDTLFPIVDRLSIDILLGTKFFDKHLFAIILEERKVIVLDSDSVAIIEQENLLSNSVLNYKGPAKVSNRTLYEMRNDSKTGEEHSISFVSPNK